MKYNQNFLSTVKIIVLAAVLAVGVSYVSAQSWTAPTQTPPSGNTAAPVNVSSTAQTKLGALIVNGGTVPAATGLSVPSGKVGIGLGASVPSTQLHVSNSVSGPEVARFDTGTLGGASFVRVQSTAGSNLFGVEAAGGWVGTPSVTAPASPLPLNFKVGDGVVGKFATNGNLELTNQLKISGGTPAAGEVLTATNDTGIATWEPVNQSIQPSYSYPQSVVSVGATDTQLGQNPFANNIATYTASCPSGKILVSCSGGVLAVNRQAGLTYDTGTIIVPNTSTQTCTMYSTEVGDLGPGSPDSAVRLYAMCI